MTFKTFYSFILETLKYKFILQMHLIIKSYNDKI